MKILVRNLNRNTKAESLKTHYEQHGFVSDCVIVMDEATNRSKGFGFVTMPNPKEATLAIKRTNLTRFEGDVLRVKLAEEK